VGGSSTSAGVIFGGSGTSSITIGHSLLGGIGVNAGLISLQSVDRLTIGGSMIGGSNSLCGAVLISGALGVLKIGGNLKGGDVTGVISLDRSGYIQVGRLGSATIGGSIIAGRQEGTGDLTFNASI